MLSTSIVDGVICAAGGSGNLEFAYPVMDIAEEVQDGSLEYESCVPIDLAIALDHLTLAAVEEGLGTCWVGALNEERVKELLSVPDEMRAPLVMSIGYTDTWPEPRPRKPLGEIICYDRYR
jgi:nitroreductase